MSEFTIRGNFAEVQASFAAIAARLQQTGVTVSRDVGERAATRAREFAHVGPDPTHPPGRPHMRDTILSTPLGGGRARVTAEGGAVFEEARGGDHAFLTRAVQAVEPEALTLWEQSARAALNAE